MLLNTLVRPSDQIPADSTDIHGIDDPAVADAPTWDQVYPLVGRILDQYGPVVVYNADFDRRILHQTNRIYGLPDFDVEWHCAMKQHAAYVGIWHETYETWRWHKLSEALRMLSLPAPPVRHRALADAESCRQIVAAMAGGTRPGIPYGQQTSPAISPAVLRDRQEDAFTDEPFRPEVIAPGEERHGDEPSWSERSGSFAGAQYTVISTRTSGCSSGALVLALFVGVILIGLCCCGFFYLAMVLA